jgi:hypothetical protein
MGYGRLSNQLNVTLYAACPSYPFVPSEESASIRFRYIQRFLGVSNDK